MKENNPNTSVLLEQLSLNSTPYQDPLGRINWESLEQDMFWLPEPAISLYGLNEYESLPVAQRRALSQYEFLHFIEAGVWLESLFIERMSRELRHRYRHSQHIYILHELREELGHLLMYNELMRRCGLILPNSRFHNLAFFRYLSKIVDFDSSLFWSLALIGEEVSDRLNRFIRKNAQSICPAIYDIVSIHIMDEARHIAHSREILEHRLKFSHSLQRKFLFPFVNSMFRQFVRSFYFPPARVYELAGLTPAKRWAKKAQSNAHRLQFVDECINTTLHVLREHNIYLHWR